jgi:predicted aldo/keto reductase-like oxidoreductase
MPPGEATPEPTHLYRHALSHPAVDMVLTAPKDQAQLAANLRALEDGPLDPEEQAWLARVGKHVRRLSPHGNWDFVPQMFKRSGN